MHNNWTKEVVEKLEHDWKTKESHGAPVVFEMASKLGESFIDLGCGFGKFYDFLLHNKKSSFTYYGIDSSEAMIERAKQKYPIIAKKCFIFQDIIFPLTCDLAKVDVVLCNEVFAHLPEVYQCGVLETINSLKSNYVIITIQAFLNGDFIVENVNMKGQRFYNVIQNIEDFEDEINFKLDGVTSVKTDVVPLTKKVYKATFTVRRSV